jgi:hypothetical protein
MSNLVKRSVNISLGCTKPRGVPGGDANDTARDSVWHATLCQVECNCLVVVLRIGAPARVLRTTADSADARSDADFGYGAPHDG